MRWHNAVVSHSLSGLDRYLSSLIGLCLLHRTGDHPHTTASPLCPSGLRLPENGETLGGGSSPPGLISMGGQDTNVVSETASSAWPGVCPGLEALPEEGK